MTVAFFDFDHTITTKDSFLDFIEYDKGKKALYWAITVHFLAVIGYKIGFVSGTVMKEKFLTHFFKGESVENFQRKGEEYGDYKLPQIINPKALEKIQDHKKKGHEIVVVTASIDFWVLPWVNSLGLELISTQMEVKDSRLTGKLKGLNCNGKEKVNQIKKKYNLQSLKDTYAYGDSNGDKEMLKMANHSFYRCF